MAQTAALIYFLICVGVIVFQICLIAGAPWGKLTQGGFHTGKLPRRNRVAAGVSGILMLLLGFSMLSAAGYWPNWPIWTGWVTFVLAIVSAGMNIFTPSLPERMLWAPVTLIMLGLAATVMFSV